MRKIRIEIDPNATKQPVKVPVDIQDPKKQKNLFNTLNLPTEECDSINQAPELTEENLINNIKEQTERRFHEDIDGWCEIKKKESSPKEYLAFLERQKDALNDKDLKTRMGNLFTANQIKVENSKDATISGNAIWTKKSIYKETLKNHKKEYEKVDLADWLYLLNVLSGKQFETIDDALRGGNPIDWAMAAPFWGATKYKNNPNSPYWIGIPSKRGKTLGLEIDPDKVHLEEWEEGEVYECPVRLKNA